MPKTVTLEGALQILKVSKADTFAGKGIGLGASPEERRVQKECSAVPRFLAYLHRSGTYAGLALVSSKKCPRAIIWSFHATQTGSRESQPSARNVG